MSNRQFSLTVKACDVLENVPKRSRSKFVSDAIVAYAKKKGVLEEYITKSTPEPAKRLPKQPEASESVDSDEKQSSPEDATQNNVNVDSGY